MIEVRRSPVHGLGCFAVVPIPAGALVVEYDGERIARNEALRRAKTEEYAFGEYLFEIDEDRFVDASRTAGPGRYINHSCAPNCRIERHDGRAFVVALRKIAAGEEIAYDYAFEEPYRIACRCGTQGCRGLI